jgi:outer membrane protein
MSKCLVFTVAMLSAAPAAAQLQDRNGLTLGLGLGTIPSYEGSDNYRMIPAPLIRGRVAGFNFTTVRTHLYVDAWRDGPGRWDVQVGPVIGANLNRTAQIGDARVRALGKLDIAVEGGGFVGVARTGLATPFDSLAVVVSYQQDLGDVHGSHLIRPQIAYTRPLDLKTALRVGIGAEIVGAGFARTYFGVTPDGAAASGLPEYRLGSGLKDVNLSAGVTRALGGTLLKGWSAFGAVGVSHLLGDFADSPVVRIAGERNTFFGSVGLAYSF